MNGDSWSKLKIEQDELSGTTSAGHLRSGMPAVYIATSNLLFFFFASAVTETDFEMKEIKL